MVVIAKSEGERHIVRALAMSEEGALLLTSLFRDSSADLIWFGRTRFMAIFRRPARKLLEPQGLQDLVSRLLSLVSLIEGLAGQPEEVVAADRIGSSVGEELLDRSI
jgi:hypothetical protein